MRAYTMLYSARLAHGRGKLVTNRQSITRPFTSLLAQNCSRSILEFEMMMKKFCISQASVATFSGGVQVDYSLFSSEMTYITDLEIDQSSRSISAEVE